ncbi:MAG: corrinoid protein [Desulfomonilaceae bacterium]|nr:corrinoid protein [Desulfomonilaceae bacterium]
MNEYESLTQAVIKGDIQLAVSETRKYVDAGADVQSILDKGLIAAMDTVGENFSTGRIFVPQMLRSAKTMQECMNIIKPLFQEGDVTTKGTVVIGTVKGDLHDIGKNLVSMMLEGAGFAITDLGVDVPPDKFVQKAQEVGADVVGMSALLSITMPGMPATIEALTASGLKEKVKVIVGGAPVTEKYANEIDADGYAPDAATAVVEVKKLLGIS